MVLYSLLNIARKAQIRANCTLQCQLGHGLVLPSVVFSKGTLAAYLMHTSAPSIGLLVCILYAHALNSRHN